MPSPAHPVASETPSGPPLPRELIFLASLWLVASWLVSIGVNPPLHPTAMSYAPGVRTMVLCVTVGLVIAWPLLRLSQRPTPWPLRRTLLDLVTLIALTQVIVWPIRLVTIWGVDRTLAITLTIGGWTLLAGALTAIATGVGRDDLSRRTAAILGCCLLCVAGPAAAFFAATWTEVRGAGPVWEGGFAAWLGPLVGVHTLTGGPVTPIRPEEWHSILTLLAAAVAVWVVVAVTIGLRPRAGSNGISRGRPVSSPSEASTNPARS